MASPKAKRGGEPLEEATGRIKMSKMDGTTVVAGPSTSDKILLEGTQQLLLEGEATVPDSPSNGELHNGNDSNTSTPKKRGGGQKRGRSWNREEEILLMDAWNKVAERGLKAKDVTMEVEREFHEMARKKWGADRQTTLHALDRKGGSLLARAKGLIRQFSELVTFARKHTGASNFPHNLSNEALEKIQVEINQKRTANGIELFRSWHVRDALIYHYTHFTKTASASNGGVPSKIQKRKSYPQDPVVTTGMSRQQIDVERQKLDLERQRFKEAQRVASLDSLHKLLSTLDADDETAPVVREQILKLNTIL